MAANKAVLLAECDAQERHPVNSSNVEWVAYAADFARLYVAFKGSLYVYHDVGRSTFEAFLAAPSKGKFVYHTVRNGGRDDLYPYDRLT